MGNIEQLENKLRDIKKVMIELRLEQNLKGVDNNSKILELEKEGNKLVKDIYDHKCTLNSYYVSFNYSFIESDYPRFLFQTKHYSDIDIKIDTTNSIISNHTEFIKLRDSIIQKYIEDYMFSINNIIIKRIE